MTARIAVTVVYARPGLQAVRRVTLEAGSTLSAAIQASGLLQELPEIDLSANRTGVFGRPASLDAPLCDGDQVEVYRPLAADPNELRRERARRRR